MAAEGPRGELDAHRSTHIAVLGKKGTGKTELAFHVFETYPFDRIAVDPNADIVFGPDVEELPEPPPARWPEWPAEALGRKPRRRTFRYVPDFGDPAYREDLDRVIGLAYGHPRTLLFVDEAHEAFPAGRVLPHARRALRQSRHRQLSMILATPRPLTVDPLVISQADWVYIFRLPNPNDRKRVAECIGWDPKAFDEAVFALGRFEYLRYDAGEEDLAHFPPLPAHVIRHHAAH